MAYNQETIFEKNQTLSFEFERYILDHPETLDQIPSSAEIVLLPKYDPELYQINLEMIQDVRHQDDHPLVVYVEIEALAPSRSRLINPYMTSHPMASA